MTSVTSMGTSIAAVGISAFSLISQRRQASRESRRRAVERLNDALASLYELIEHADVQWPYETEVSAAMQRFDRECRGWQYQLPTAAGHFPRSARQAMAHCFGAPAIVGLDPRAASLPADAFDRHWWDVGSTWFEHAQRQLQRWLSYDRGRTLEVTPYYAWRRDEDQLRQPTSQCRWAGELQ